MAQTSKRTTIFEVPPATLLEVVTSAEFQEEQRKLDQAVIDTKFVEKTRTDDKLVFELRSTEYDRGVKGLNKKKTIQSVTSVEWNLKRMSGTWTYSSPATDRVKLRGTHKIEPNGDKARFIAEFTVEVKIPLIGKKVESMIVSGMTKGREGYDDLLKSYLAKQG